jgi:hypothetical protein
MTIMPDADWEALTPWQKLRHRSTLAKLAGVLVLGAALGAGGWYVKIRPLLQVNRMRHESTLDIARMYGLQLSYKKQNGVYANDLDALLSAAPDRAALKANLVKNVDMTTLAVVGDARKFKIELNVLDADRTPIRVRGPIAPRRPKTPAPTMTEASAQMNADGTPVALPAGR